MKSVVDEIKKIIPGLSGCLSIDMDIATSPVRLVYRTVVRRLCHTLSMDDFRIELILFAEAITAKIYITEKV